MNHTAKRKLKKLPYALHPWELVIGDLPAPVAGLPNIHAALAIDRGTGKIRSIGLITGPSVDSCLADLFFKPIEGFQPSKPRQIYCNDPLLAAELERLLKHSGIAILLVDTLPAAEQVLHQLGAAPPTAQIPGIDSNRAEWKQALDRFAEEHPWDGVSDLVTFHFRDNPDIENSVGILVGMLGQQRGIVLFETQADLERFQAHQDLRIPFRGHYLALYLLEAHELTPEERKACDHAGLVTPDDLYPMVTLVQDGRPGAATLLQQRCMLAATQAILQLWLEHEELLEVVDTTAALSTCIGPLTVSTTRDDDEPLEHLFPWPYRVFYGTLQDIRQGTTLPALYLKMAKRDAERAAALLAPVDSLRIDLEGYDGIPVLAMAGSQCLGMIDSIIDGHLVHLRHSEMVLVVSAGGAKRRSINPSQFVFTRQLPVTIVGR